MAQRGRAANSISSSAGQHGTRDPDRNGGALEQDKTP